MKPALGCISALLISTTCLTSSAVADQKLYVLWSARDSVSSIDVSTNRILATIEVGELPHGIASPASQDVLYVTAEGIDQLTVIDTRRDQVIARYPVGLASLGAWTVNHPKGRLCAAGIASEAQDRLAELRRHDDAVRNLVVRDPVHRPAQPGGLSFDSPNRLRSSVRQPGEHRNLRVGHSVRYQDFLALGVIGQRARVPDHQRGFLRQCTPYRALGRYITLDGDVIDGQGVVAEVGYPELIVLGV